MKNKINFVRAMCSRSSATHYSGVNDSSTCRSAILWALKSNQTRAVCCLMCWMWAFLKNKPKMLDRNIKNKEGELDFLLHTVAQCEMLKYCTVTLSVLHETSFMPVMSPVVHI